MQTNIIKNVELHWLKLEDKPQPDQFGFMGWSVVIQTRDKAKAQELKKLGLNVKQDGGNYKATIKQPTETKAGKANTKPRIVDSRLKPIEDPTIVGNGSVGNIQTFSFEWTFSGKKGVSHRLQAIQVTDLKKYEKGAPSVSFSEEDGFDLDAEQDSIEAAKQAEHDELWD